MADTNVDAGSGALSVLAAGAAALARANDLDMALAVIVEAGAAATGATMAAVFAQDADRNSLELLLTLGIEDDDVEAFEAEVVTNPEHPIHHAALDRTGSLSRVGQTPDGATMTGADLPLVVASSGNVEACVGVLTFGWAGEHEVGTEEEALLVAVADLAAAAIATYRTSSMASERAEWLERVALTDPLTGLANARTVTRVLELEVARAQRQGSEISVALFDVDGFRDLNAASGSRAGDHVLRQVASVLAESVRLVDTIARTGGDEFVLVAPGPAGVTVARRVLDGVAKLDAVDGHTISVSAAIAHFPQDGSDAGALLEAARSALTATTEPASIVEVTGGLGSGPARRGAGVGPLQRRSQARQPAGHAPQRLDRTRQHHFRVAGRVHDGVPVRLGRGETQEGRPDPLVVRGVLERLEPGDLRRLAGEAHLHRQVQEDREVRHQAAGREALHLAQLVHRHAGAGALVGQRGVRVAVAQHHGATGQGGRDDLVHVLGPRGGEQQRVRASAAVDGWIHVENEPPHQLAEGAWSRARGSSPPRSRPPPGPRRAAASGWTCPSRRVPRG